MQEIKEPPPPDFREPTRVGVCVCLCVVFFTPVCASKYLIVCVCVNASTSSCDRTSKRDATNENEKSDRGKEYLRLCVLVCVRVCVLRLFF